MEYIKFGKYLVNNELESILILYDYFLLRPIIKPSLLRIPFRIADVFFRRFLKILFYLKLNIFLPTKNLNEEFIVSMQGNSKYATKILLVKEKNSFKIIKRYSEKRELTRELNFIRRYRTKNSVIRQPYFYKLNDFETRMDFIKGRNLRNQILSGAINIEQLLKLYETLAKALDTLYHKSKGKHCLIHGDLSLVNVYLFDEKICLIDFQDSHTYEKDYDKFIFLKRALYCYYGRDRYDIIKQYFATKQIEKYDQHFVELKTYKHQKIINKK